MGRVEYIENDAPRVEGQETTIEVLLNKKGSKQEMLHDGHFLQHLNLVDYLWVST